MRRALLICLMLLLPAQWGWAAAAKTCLHESGAVSAHFGHHLHQHEVSASSVDAANAVADSGDAQGQPSADHADCGVCHLSAAKVCVDLTHQFDAEPSAERHSALAPHYTSHIPHGPERPDRAATP